MAEVKPEDAPAKPWYVYLVRAANGSLYCGISNDPQRRFLMHQSGKGARYFHASPAVALVYMEAWPSKGEALRHERLIKKLRKSAKEALAASVGPSAIMQAEAPAH
ncbi:GIY-YIG nuclease family protein [Pseudomonas syringae]|nr:GIY-YIG nuclease family protein [Pseudomonas syringae]MBD8574919.1 GIY-YIG nuclease family protein [Pseudomonas syringae]MBD8789641.1 GIY-YIG nuclease family protein [Pseudomonas syringae]MBD8800830.1 GIY-YIG nuclease family protein [Pseudomonas syringae]MBD8812211.1 GIY-YIG nuclease family protein [Pseudomonas syringae]